MAKYSYELKKKIIQEYFEKNAGLIYLTDKYNITNRCIIQQWIKNYLSSGDEGLHRSRQNRTYSFEYKLHMVKSYLTSEVSFRDLAAQEGINNPAVIARWVNDFRIAGPDALRPKKKGRKKIMTKDIIKKIHKSSDKDSADISRDYIRQLEDELLKLRIENAYLKELRRLRLEEETLLKRKRESYTVSEENSD